MKAINIIYVKNAKKINNNMRIIILKYLSALQDRTNIILLLCFFTLKINEVL